MDKYQHPTGRVPELVDLVCLGESARTDYLAMQLTKGQTLPPAEETWTLNRGIRAWRCDLAFILDEIDNEAEQDPDYGKAMRAFLASGKPVITTRIRGDFSDLALTVREFPARAVLEYFSINVEKEDPYWHNSVPMILAYAAAIGVKQLRLWGADYTLPNGRVLESDRACCEHWIGRCIQRGMSVGLSPNTTLCNRNKGALQVYGLLNTNPKYLREWLRSGPSTIATNARVEPCPKCSYALDATLRSDGGYTYHCDACDSRYSSEELEAKK